jgi:hypothetical protein
MCTRQIFTDILESRRMSIFRIDYEDGISAFTRNGHKRLPRGIAMNEWMNECMHKGWGILMRPSMIYYASPFLYNSFSTVHFEWKVGLCLWGIMVITWFHKKLAQLTNSLNKVWPHKHIGCVWVIHLFPGTVHKWSHLSIPVWKYVISGDCPVNSPTTHLNWSLFNFYRSIVLLAGDPSVSPFACWSPVMDSHCFLWFLFVQSVATFLATPVEMPQAGLGPVNGCSDPVLAGWFAISLSKIPSWLGTHISWTLLCLASCMRDWWQSQTSFEMTWCLPSPLIAAWLSDRI